VQNREEQGRPVEATASLRAVAVAKLVVRLAVRLAVKLAVNMAADHELQAFQVCQVFHWALEAWVPLVEEYQHKQQSQRGAHTRA